MDSSAPQVSAGVGMPVARLGARFTLFVTAAYDPGVEVNLREPVDLGPAFEVKKRVSENHERADGKHVREWQIDVLPWELGELSVPPIAVTFTVAGRAGQVMSNSVPVRVLGMLGDTDDPKLMRDSAAPLPLTSRDWLWVWVGGAVGAVLGGALTAVWVRRRRRRRVASLIAGAVTVPRRIDMTSERALERLLAIEQSGVLEVDGTRKRGYAELSEVIRDYLGARYKITTSELTTDELVRALQGAAPSDERQRVERWIERCDLVKYGGFRATQIDAAEVLSDARTLVIATPSIAAEPAKEAA